MKARHPAIRAIRGLGCYFGVEIDGASIRMPPMFWPTACSIDARVRD